MDGTPHGIMKTAGMGMVIRRVLLRLYGKALYALPASFRVRYGPELIEAVERRLDGAAPAGLAATLMAWSAEMMSLLRVAWDLRVGGPSRESLAIAGGAVLLVLVVARFGTITPPPRAAGAFASEPVDARFNARDPAGAFTMDVRQGRVVAATVDGAAVPPSRIVHQGDSVRLVSATGLPAVSVRFDRSTMSIEWDARAPTALAGGT